MKFFSSFWLANGQCNKCCPKAKVYQCDLQARQHRGGNIRKIGGIGQWTRLPVFTWGLRAFEHLTVHQLLNGFIKSPISFARKPSSWLIRNCRLYHVKSGLDWPPCQFWKRYNTGIEIYATNCLRRRRLASFSFHLADLDLHKNTSRKIAVGWRFRA